MIKQFKNKSGFSLIELLLVIAIIGLLSSASYAGFNKFTKQQNMSVVFDDLQNALAEAKSDALSHVVKNCTTGELLGYQVVFSTSSTPNTYSLQEVCNPALVGPALTVKTKSLPSDVNFTSPVTIGFLALSGGSNRPGTVKITNGTQTRFIRVDVSGVIQPQ